VDELQQLKQKLRRFAGDRDWDQFHSPKNLAMALNVEAGELLEHFQWLTEAESAAVTGEKRIEVADEIADVQIYLIRLADKLGIDILDAANNKFEKNEKKYPPEKARGNRKKYNEYTE